ncbi:GMC family oxidoreductase N-terminal domain-containing protein [Novosphingobium sp. G106]|nr:GMC family oxidoreductase N-terminal domain-containing protein [Novosphingobium sp. G106]
MRDQYDYIIVGAGSAGCPLAERLSADPARTVLLVESGPPDKSLFVHMPRGLGLLLNPGSKYIWDYQVETGDNRPTERWYRGRTLGGSSSVNGMIYMRGAPLDYDSWAAMGCHGWNWRDVAPVFVALEDHDLGPGPDRGAGGPQRITTHPAGDPLCDAILDAAQEMGISRVADVNGTEAVREGGIGYQPSTRWQGQRYSSARAFLEGARGRPNLHVATETDVLRVEFDGQRAHGIRIRSKSGERSVAAMREVIVSAGAIETPLLLQRSGIGPASLLQSLDIPVVVDAPEVGRNLREHRHADLRLQVRGRSQNRDLGGWRAGLSMFRYLAGRKGPMTHSAHEVGGFAKSDPALPHADLQFGLMTVSASSSGKEGDIALDPFPGITFVTYFTRPESQGEVRLTKADGTSPYINANHLSAEIDRQRFVAAFRWNRRLGQQPALKAWVVEECLPSRSLESDDDILANAMSLGGSCFHSAGTARMGSDELAVVDPQLRVRGVSGLRVADTSIMPTLVSGNTNGPAMMIGLRAAEFILSESAFTGSASVLEKA